MNRADLINQLSDYQSLHAEEMSFISRFLELLAHPDCYKRTLESGHITGSSWIIDGSRQYVLLTHHKKLDRWLQLGGHADGDENIINVATREAEEESGLKSIKLMTESIFDIDIHIIPENPKDKEHYHYDVRFLFEADMNEKLVISNESKDLKWIKVDALAELTQNDKSMMRMVKKVFSNKKQNN